MIDLKHKIGFIGLGQMGLPMSINLMKSGYSVEGYDIDIKALKNFKEQQGYVANNLRELFLGKKIIITMLPNGKIVKKIIMDMLRSNKAPYKDLIIIDMSSSDPIGTRNFAKILSKYKIKLLDAPVSGGVKKAISGDLSIMVSGEKKIIKKVTNVLKSMGANIIETGAIGSAHAMKAINNYVSAIGLMAASEAILVGREFGIKADTINDVLNISSGKNNSTENKIKQFIISNKFSSGFSLSLMSKDLNLAYKLSKYLNLRTNGIKYAAGAWKKANNNLHKNSDHTEIFNYLEKVSTNKA